MKVETQEEKVTFSANSLVSFSKTEDISAFWYGLPHQ
jgi:hypothetical protein